MGGKQLTKKTQLEEAEQGIQSLEREQPYPIPATAGVVVLTAGVQEGNPNITYNEYTSKEIF